MPLDAATEADAADWLRLLLTPAVSPALARRLLAHFGSAHALFRAAPSQLTAVARDVRARALAAPDAARERAVQASLDWARAPDHHLMTLQDPDYPPGLLQIDDPPLLLFIAGQRERLTRPNLAVVGSRNATASGCGHARRFAHGLSAAGWTITSGLALGIDAAAHAGGLAGGRGTLAVVGTGVDIVYPARHATLAEQIRTDGAVISELPLGTPPLPRLFPRRNRLIAGLSSGVLVVEAALRSGSLITARLAGEYGREVFAIPGSIDSPVARGCHALIRQGAKLVETVEEVLEECRAPGPGLGPGPTTVPELESSPSSPSSPSGPPGPHRPDIPVVGRGKDPVLDAIGFEAVLPDTLAEHLGWAAGTLAARLIELELEGSVHRRPDGRVTRPSPKG